MGEIRRSGRRWWPVLRLLLMVLAAGLLSANAASQGATPPTQSGSATVLSEDFYRWLLTQGGLTIALIVLFWSYRRDLTRWADDRVAMEQRVGDIERGRSAEMQRHFETESRRRDDLSRLMQKASDAMTEHAVALARNTDSTHRLANAVEKLDSRVERVEHKSGE